MTDVPHASIIEAELDAIDREIVFAAVSGAHLYGFPSENSDVDVRGAFLPPTEDVLALEETTDTLDRTTYRDGLEVDIVLHELEKCVEMLLGRNGVVLEQIFSPLVAHTGETHSTLRKLAEDCLTRHHAHHYRGFADSRWEAYDRSGELKPLLYAYRALLSGIHLMQNGRVQANLPELADRFDCPELAELAATKRQGREHMEAPDTEFGQRETFDTWRQRLETAHEETHLPDAVADETRHRLSDLLVDLRLDRT